MPSKRALPYDFWTAEKICKLRSSLESRHRPGRCVTMSEMGNIIGVSAGLMSRLLKGHSKPSRAVSMLLTDLASKSRTPVVPRKTMSAVEAEAKRDAATVAAEPRKTRSSTQEAHEARKRNQRRTARERDRKNVAEEMEQGWEEHPETLPLRYPSQFKYQEKRRKEAEAKRSESVTETPATEEPAKKKPPPIIRLQDVEKRKAKEVDNSGDL